MRFCLLCFLLRLVHLSRFAFPPFTTFHFFSPFTCSPFTVHLLPLAFHAVTFLSNKFCLLLVPSWPVHYGAFTILLSPFTFSPSPFTTCHFSPCHRSFQWVLSSVASWVLCYLKARSPFNPVASMFMRFCLLLFLPPPPFFTFRPSQIHPSPPSPLPNSPLFTFHPS